MNCDKARRRTQDAVQQAIERGELRRGGPSDMAARGLTEDVPTGYWEQWSRDAADRIRAQVRGARCTCFRPGERLPDGRCGRCYGRLASSSTYP